MIGFSYMFLAFLAVSRKKTTWFIDGNNLMGHRGTPRDRESIEKKLLPMKDQNDIVDVKLVFDAHRGEGSDIDIVQDGCFSTVVMGEGKSADEFIMEEIQKIVEKSAVQLVTADRELRREALSYKAVKGVVNPVVFWRRYRPRLTGLKDPAEDEAQ